MANEQNQVKKSNVKKTTSGDSFVVPNLKWKNEM